MTLYEVNIQVVAARAEEYLAWLDDHIREILLLDGFIGADFCEVEEPVSPGWRPFSVRYRLRDAASLERYLREDAPRMRGDGVARFGDDARATRRFLTLRSTYDD